MKARVPAERIRIANDRPTRSRAEYVLYWMIAARRPGWSFALDRAVEEAARLDLPLLVFEPLRAAYPHASDRLHRFVLDGMSANRRAFDEAKVAYLPWVEPEPGAGRGLLEVLATRAALVVTDDFPAFFLPRMIEAAARKLDVRLEAVDGSGLFPFRSAPKIFSTAFDFRRFLQRNLRPHLGIRPRPGLADASRLPRLDRLPAALRRWPGPANKLLGRPEGLAALPIDHSVAVAPFAGGADEAERHLVDFVGKRLDRYADDRNAPDLDGASGLSPWLHFGQLSSHRVLDAVARHHRWDPNRIADTANGKREGWWGLPPGTEAFLDQLVTWREIGFNFCAGRPDHDRWESLPEWARATLSKHEKDRRPLLYDRRTLEAAETHDDSGTRRSGSCCARGGCRTISGCSGERRFSSGAATRARPSRR